MNSVKIHMELYLFKKYFYNYLQKQTLKMTNKPNLWSNK